jgi:hypothetical protein
LWPPVGPAAPTVVRLTSSASGVPEGDSLVLAAEVVTLPTDVVAAPATGSVTFLVDGQRLGSAELDAAGQAVLAGVRLPVGVHAVVASYPGDGQHAAASSSPIPQAVTAMAAPVVVLVSAPVQTEPGGVLLEAEVVDPRSGRLAEDAEGTVVFTVGGSAVGSADLVRGYARLELAALPPGRLRASYDGDTEHASAVGSAPANAS